MNEPALRLYEFGPFRINVRERQLERRGEVVPLTPKVFDTLLLLVENGGHVLGKDELMRTLWPDSFVAESSLTQNISLLRRTLGEFGDERQYIETIPKRGYRFIGGVREFNGSNGELVMQGRSGTQIDFEGEKFVHTSQEPVSGSKTRQTPVLNVGRYPTHRTYAKTDVKIRALIVDDESLARKFIRRMLKEEREVEIVGECRDGADAVAAIRKLMPDLVFLDVQMPEMDGFEVLEAVGVERLPEIVFTTAYENYAIRAFELHALDYLLKPFDQARFRDTIVHAKQRIQQRQFEDGRLQIGALLENVKRQPEYLHRLIIKADGRIKFLKTQEIDWIEADDKYVHLHTAKTSPMVRQTLNAMEAQLDPKKFLRIHRSSIINVERVKELHPLLGGEYTVVMEDGTRLTLSRKYKDRLFELLGKPL